LDRANVQLQRQAGSPRNQDLARNGDPIAKGQPRRIDRPAPACASSRESSGWA
jgi:hypothetical protein